MDDDEELSEEAPAAFDDDAGWEDEPPTAFDDVDGGWEEEVGFDEEGTLAEAAACDEAAEARVAEQETTDAEEKLTSMACQPQDAERRAGVPQNCPPMRPVW